MARRTEFWLRAGLGAILLATSAAATAEPWFGQALPPPLNDPTVAVVKTDGSDLPAQPALFGPGPTSPYLDGARIKADVRTLAAFSLESRAAGEYLWGRVSGNKAFYDTILWAVGELKAAGLRDAHVDDFTASLNTPTAGEIRLLGAASHGEGSRDVVLQSAMVGGRGPVSGSVTAPLIYVGHGTAADMLGRDVRGKIAVIHVNVNPGLYSADEIGRTAQMIKAGAAGVIEILDQPGNMQSYDGDRHGCGTGLCFTVGGADGFFLENILGKAGQAGTSVSATLSATAVERTGLRSANAVATIPGKSRRTIVINAHADGWFIGGDDNAGGVATALALARYFARQPKPEHTLVFLISAGHHTPGLGIPDFRLKHEADYVETADLFINLEHVANAGLMRAMTTTHDDNFGRPMVATTTELPKAVAVSNRAPFLIDLWRQGAACFGLAVQRTVDPVPPGEMGSFRSIQRMAGFLDPKSAGRYSGLKDVTDVPITQMISAGPLYHTTGEGVDSVPEAGLERAARFHAFLIREADRARPELLKGADWTARTSCPATP
ncbi:MAG TPA: M28 family peptidase [Allosphingosinicella sp.]